MRFVRFGNKGVERPGILDARGGVRDASVYATDITPETAVALRDLDPADLPLVAKPGRFGVPLTGIGDIICIGLNYRAHAAETGAAEPSEPVVFSKHTSALNGPNDPLRIPPGSAHTDWEVELGVIIGKAAYRVPQAKALKHVLGYTVVNDVSERDYQKNRSGQWIKGKSSPTFCPVGPVLVTADEVADPQALDLWLKVNGEVMQQASTADMIFPVAHLVSYLSHFMELRPGDLICTGTPAGVGMGRGVYLKPGDVVELGIGGLCEQRQDVIGC